MPNNGYLDITQITSVANDFTTKADERFLNVNNMTPSSASDINNLKKSIWPKHQLPDINNYNSSSIIPYDEFESILDYELYDNRIIGARVTDSNGHNWRIIENNGDSYDLWYEGSIGEMQYNTSYEDNSYAQWCNSNIRTQINGSAFYNNTSLLPTNMKSRVIPKSCTSYVYNGTSGPNTDDNVWILSDPEVGGGGDSETTYTYFINSNKKDTGFVYWTSSGKFWSNKALASRIWIGGGLSAYNEVTRSYNVIPCIRVQ